MKKALLLLPIILCSCASNMITTSENTTSESTLKDVSLNVYQLYEKPYGEGNWSNPRLDLTLSFKEGDKVILSEIQEQLRPSYQCYGDGYYWIEAYWINIDLFLEVKTEFVINDNMDLYYGCRG